MSIERYWQERLVSGFPLRSRALYQEGYDLRSWSGKTGVWPRAVARQSLYADYQDWHAEVFLAEYQNSEFFQSHPDMVPKPATEMQFFVTMGPWLYIDGKSWHVKNYNVKKQERSNGEWVKVTARRYFIRLVELERHTRVFEASVGRSIRPPRERLVYT